MQTEILSLKDSFDSMMETKEVNLDAIPLINKIKEELSEKKDLIISKKLSKESIFPVYHSVNISNKVLDNISIRLKKAKENKDNPKIAKDTLEIYPSLLTLTVNLDTIDIKNKEVLTSHLLNFASDLQISALRAKLFDSQQEISEDILVEVKEVVKNLKIEEIFNEQEQRQSLNRY